MSETAMCQPTLPSALAVPEYVEWETIQYTGWRRGAMAADIDDVFGDDDLGPDALADLQRLRMPGVPSQGIAMR